ncbi:MAG: tetratricopeptide repeat protein [Asgard group archaeon]|nr:tetratricopeptide repeat protein [Asgard group archaeon]
MKKDNIEMNPEFLASFNYQVGDFNEAARLFEEILVNDSENFQALVMLGNIALLKNSFEKAINYLDKAILVAPEEPSPYALLAEVYYRQDNYEQAAIQLRQYGIVDMAERLESFDDLKPYNITSEKSAYTIKLLQIDPLPIIEVQINNHEPVNFLIDTGAAEIIIDLEYANEINLQIFGSKTGTFAGGKKATTFLGKIASIKIGDLEVQNIPVKYIPVRPFSQIFQGKRIDGIIGTVFFYHFITTLDYLNGELTFRKNTLEQLKLFEESITEKNPIFIPFWMAEDHFMVSWGKVNNSSKALFFLDTGLAGGGFTGSKSILDEGGVEIDESKAFEGIGGGGKVKAIPFVVEKLSFGEMVKENINGVFTENFPIEHSLGFRIGGIVSHQFFRNCALTFDFIKMRFIITE